MADDLRSQLGADPPGSIQGLSEADRTELAEILREARQRQDRTLEAAFAATLKHVPFPVRGIVKKVLIG